MFDFAQKPDFSVSSFAEDSGAGTCISNKVQVFNEKKKKFFPPEARKW